MRARTTGVVSRRSLRPGATALAAGAWAGLGIGRAVAATDITFLGWQGYDEGVLVDDFAKNQGLNLATTYIGNNDEIISKLTAGGLGPVDIVTPYMGYVPLLAKAELIAADRHRRRCRTSRDVMPLFRNDKNINVDGELYGVPFTWGSGPMMYDPAVIPDAAGLVDRPAEARVQGQGRHDGRPARQHDAGGDHRHRRRGRDAADHAEQLEAVVDYLIEMKRAGRASWR